MPCSEIDVDRIVAERRKNTSFQPLEDGDEMARIPFSIPKGKSGTGGCTKVVEDCPEPKRSILYQHLGEIKYTVINIEQMFFDIARQLIEMRILPPKSYDDCQHIAAAVECGCDCIVSWNFKHIVNIRTIRGVRAITNLKGYKPIEILNPSVLLESEE